LATLVLVTSRAEHIEACQRCADTLGVHLQTCVLDDAATRVARWRPFVLLVDEDFYDFDPKEFSDLARDVGAGLMTLPADEDAGRLARELIAPLAAAYQERYPNE
jgi:hypothetical protein